MRLNGLLERLRDTAETYSHTFHTVIRATTTRRCALYGTVLGLVVALAIYRGSLDPSDRGMVENLLAEALGVLVTVFVIDTLSSAIERSRTRLARFAAYRDALRVYSMTREFWVTLVANAGDSQPIDLAGQTNIFARPFGEMVWGLDINDREARKNKKLSWQQYLPQEAGRILAAIDRCLQRYSGHMDAEMIVALQELERRNFFEHCQHNVFYLDATFGWGKLDDSVRFGIFLESFRSMLERQAQEFQGLPGFERAPSAEYSFELNRLRQRWNSSLPATM